ncbi:MULTISPECIES: hypothetical protein [Actinoalloteichus]|uniref:PLL-like beta propeller domain-containing protein n=1 Tax=Actinoalloteichus fjordicus TaxID=1612552 RepID=A0AAC9LGH7_9PSEU|nr:MULTISPECIES: hypothetical protein [Actinoalloteichus]APU16434.1 hypothetical protein UA74_22080 [Actinoalloteichus fjordicus]APU22492.1 hypothetical protein UA75_22550 [Actinoalloteichus sp. GBA129-24]
MRTTSSRLRRSVAGAALALLLAAVPAEVPGAATAFATTPRESAPTGIGEPREPAAHQDIREGDVTPLAANPISREEIMARGRTWVDAGVPYSMSRWHEGYRTDCSGFVSLAWNTGASYTTRTIYQVSHEITKDELLPGDALNWRHWQGDGQIGHIRLFGGWLDDARSRYWVYEQTPPRATYNEYTWSQTQATYQPIRFDFVAEGPPPAQNLREFTTTGSSVAAATSRDGRVEAFVSDAAGVHHRWQTAPADGRPGGGAWSDWVNTGGPANARLAFSRAPDGRLEQFALTPDGLHHRFQTNLDGAWSGWSVLGPGGTDLATAVARDGRVEVFVAHGGGIRHRWQTSPADGRPGGGAWSEWVETGGPAGAQVIVDAAPDGRLEQFATTSNGTRHRYQMTVEGAWSGWSDFGPGGHDIVTSTALDGRLEVFVADAGGVRHRWQTSPADGRPGGGAWSDWVETGGPGAARLTVALAPGGRLEQFATTSAGVRHRYQTDLNGTWSPWSDFGSGGSDLVATVNVDGRIEVFLAATEGVLGRWHTIPADGTPGGGAWSEWATFRGGAGA